MLNVASRTMIVADVQCGTHADPCRSGYHPLLVVAVILLGIAIIPAFLLLSERRRRKAEEARRRAQEEVRAREGSDGSSGA